MKKIYCLFLAVVLMLAFSSCNETASQTSSGTSSQASSGTSLQASSDPLSEASSQTTCSHEYGEWSITKEATCTEEGTKEQTCKQCNDTQTEKIAVIDHTWQDATCESPKTCENCGTTEGITLSHSWEIATCTTPKTCKICSETQGNALGHVWNKATCTEPKTCSVCGEKQGKASGHSWKDATCSTPKTCKTCGTTSGTVSEHKENAQGKCTMCGKDIFLQKIKDGLKVELLVPSVGTTNYYCQMKVTNNTGYDVVLDTRYLSANGKLFTYPNSSPNETLKSGRYVVLSFYRGVVDIYNSKYKDTYLDRTSEAYYNFKIKDKTVFVRFGVNGGVRWGYSLADIGYY